MIDPPTAPHGMMQRSHPKERQVLIDASFNCLLPAFTCGQYSECNKYNGKCSCPAGYGGDDCLSPGMDMLLPS